MAHSTRRSLLGTALTAAGTVTAVAPALAVAPGADAELLQLAAEHRALAHEYDQTVYRCGEYLVHSPRYVAAQARLDAITTRSNEIEDLVSSCKARTAAGLRAQLVVSMKTLTSDPDAEEAVDLLDGTGRTWNILCAVVEALDAGVVA